MIFLDTTYLNGLIIKKDTYSLQSKALKPLIKYERKIINSTVFTEVLNSVNATNCKYSVDELTDLLLKYDIHFLTPDDYADSAALFKHYNRSINFSDCTILKTMFDNDVDLIVSFDEDFDKIKGIRRIYIDRKQIKSL